MNPMNFNNKSKAPSGQEQGRSNSFTTISLILPDGCVKIGKPSTDSVQPMLFPDTEVRYESMMDTKKKRVLSWLCRRWKNSVLSFNKNQAASALHLSPAEFGRALWNLREDQLVSYVYRRIFHDYVLTNVEEASDD